MRVKVDWVELDSKTFVEFEYQEVRDLDGRLRWVYVKALARDDLVEVFDKVRRLKRLAMDQEVVVVSLPDGEVTRLQVGSINSTHEVGVQERVWIWVALDAAHSKDD